MFAGVFDEALAQCPKNERYLMLKDWMRTGHVPNFANYQPEERPVSFDPIAAQNFTAMLVACLTERIDSLRRVVIVNWVKFGQGPAHWAYCASLWDRGQYFAI